MSTKGSEIYKRLLRHVKPYWRRFLMAIAAMVTLAATDPPIPALLKPTLDGSFVEKDLDSVTTMAVLLVLVFLVRGVASFVSAMAMAQVAGRVPVGTFQHKITDLAFKIVGDLALNGVGEFDFYAACQYAFGARGAAGKQALAAGAGIHRAVDAGHR